MRKVLKYVLYYIYFNAVYNVISALVIHLSTKTDFSFEI